MNTIEKHTFTLRNQTLGGIQELAKNMWNEEISKGYVATGKWEYLNNGWAEKAIEYAISSNQISSTVLRRLAQDQISKSNRRKGVYLTKTGRLAYVIMEWLGEGTGQDKVRSKKIEEYRKTGVNPQTGHIHESKPLKEEHGRNGEDPIKTDHGKSLATKNKSSGTPSVRRPAKIKDDEFGDAENDRSDIMAKREYVELLTERGYEEIMIKSEPSDIVAFRKGEKYYFEIKAANSSKKGGGFGAATLTEWRQALETPDNYFFVIAWHDGDHKNFDFREYTPKQFIKFSTIPPFKIYFDIDRYENTEKTHRSALVATDDILRKMVVFYDDLRKERK